MWFGTQEGLNRYDGKEVVVFRKQPGVPDSLSHDVIRDIAEDSRQQLWIATRQGLTQYDRTHNRFILFPVFDNDVMVSRYNKLYLDSQQRFWVATDGNGLFRLDYHGQEIVVSKFDQVDELNTADVRAILLDSRNRLWIGTDHQGLFRIDQAGTFRFNLENHQLASNSVRTIHEDSRGAIWVGTRGGGLNRFNELKQQFIHYQHDPEDPRSLSHNRVYEVLEDKKGQLWIATDHGISLYDIDQDEFYNIHHKSSQASSLSHDRVLSIFEDRGGMIWLGTMAGINIWNPLLADFEHYRKVAEDTDTLSNNTVYALTETVDEHILIGTFGNGINILDPNSKKITSFQSINDPELQQQRVMSMLIDDQSRLWVGTLSNGVKIYDEKGILIKKFTHSENQPSSLSANGITDILQDSDGEYWVATYQKGLNRISNIDAKIEHINLEHNASGLLSENIYGLLEDDEGYIWIATDGGGLSRLDRNSGEIKTITNDPDVAESLSGNIVSYVFQDSRGYFWVGTFGNGLSVWRPEDRRNFRNRFVKFDMSSGLLSNSINAIIEDQFGNIWVSSNKGVNKIEPSLTIVSGINFSESIHENEFNQSAVLLSKKGRLYFGGLNGISSFPPDIDHVNKKPPELALKAIYIANNKQPLKLPPHQLRNIDFGYKDYLIAFEFVSFDYAQPERNQYQYKLEGFDPDWIQLGNNNRAVFTNLPPGQYKLKVKGSNNDGIWSDEKINLEVKVYPAPWFTWWAYSLYAATFCVLLILFIRHQARRLASEDMVYEQVKAQVKEKTNLYQKSNELLKHKLQTLQTISLFDEETQLVSQSAFFEMGTLALNWLVRALKERESERLQLFVFVLAIEIESEDLRDGAFSNDFANIVSQAVQPIADQFDVVARWDRLKLSGFVLQSCNNQAPTTAERLLTKIRKSISPQLPRFSLKLGYTTPLYEQSVEELDFESVMMLTEHLAQLAQADEGDCFVGIDKIHQPLNKAIVKQTLMTTNVDELRAWFAVKSGVIH
jgi:ligand-binding sensor domain-containing protein/GGDEF domain-containing protein